MKIYQITQKMGIFIQIHQRMLSNVYWCKIEIVLNELKWRLWLCYLVDSDTAIKNNQIDIGSILNQYHTVIYLLEVITINNLIW